MLSNKSKESFWKLFDNGSIVVLLLALPVALFLITAYFQEGLVAITMPIFLYWMSMVFMLLSIHAIKRRIFQFFDHGPVFAHKTPISFWVLVCVELMWAAIIFAVATIYMIDHWAACCK